MEEKTLPISYEPHVKAYVHHMFLHSIMQNSDNLGDVLFRLNMNDYGKYFWDSKLNDCTMDVKEDTIILSADKYADNTETFIMRECRELDQLILHVDYQQYTNADCIINLLFCNDNVQECIDTDKGIFRFGIMKSNGIYAKMNEQYLYMPAADVKVTDYPWLRLSVEVTGIAVAISRDGKEWQEILNRPLPEGFVKGPMKIGINTNAGENQYYNWFFSNYLNLFYAVDNAMLTLDYYNGPSKFFSYHRLHQFFDFEHVYLSELQNRGAAVKEHIREELRKGRYVMISLDSYVVEGNAKYHKEKFYHPYLIYGYDEEKFKVIGFDEGLIRGTVTYDEFATSVAGLRRTDKIESIIYAPNRIKYKFDPEVVYHSLRDFLSGNNPSIHTANIVPKQEGYFGLDAYDRLLTVEHSRLCLDHRNAYVIYEYNHIMRERLEFMYKKGHIKEEKYSLLKPLSEELCEKSNILLTRIMMNKYKNGTEKGILERFEEITSLQRKLAEKMVA